MKRFGIMIIMAAVGISCLAACGPALAADTSVITAAVLDLEFKEGVSAGVVSTVSDYLRTQLVKTNKFIIVTRENMESILKEQQFQLSGCTSQECIVQLGQLLGVRKMFTGSIGKVGTTYIINLKIIDVQTGKIDKADAEEAYTEDQLLPAVRNLASKMAGTAPQNYIAQPQAAQPAPEPYAAAAQPEYTPYVPSVTYEKGGFGTYWSLWEIMAKPLPGGTFFRSVVPYGSKFNDFGPNIVPAFTVKIYNSGTGNDFRFDFAYKTYVDDMSSLTFSIVPASFHLIPDKSSPVQVYIDIGIDMWIGWGDVTNWCYGYFDVGEGLHGKAGVEVFAGPVGLFFEGGVGVVIMDLELWEDRFGKSYDDSTFFSRLYYPLNFGARVYF